MTRQDDSESRMPSVLAFAAACYLISVPLLSLSDRLGVSWLPQVIGVGVVLSWLVFGVVRGRRMVLSKPIVLYVAWILWAASGFLVAGSPEWFWQRYQSTFKVVVIAWVCCQCVRTRADLLFCLFLAGSASLIIFFAGVDEILRAATYQGQSQAGRIEAGGTLIENANGLAITMVMLLIANTICFLTYRNLFVKLVSVISIPFALYILSASGSRTGMVGLLVAGAMAFWFHFRRTGRSGLGIKLGMLLVGMAMLAGTVAFVVNNPFFFRLAETFSSADEASRQPRWRYTITAIEATAERPVFGLGLAGFASSGLAGWQRMHYSHSTLAETLSCTGFPGFLLYYGSQLALFMLIRKVRKSSLPPRDAAIVNLLMAMFFVLQFFNLVGVLYYDRLLWPLLGVICGYLEHLRHRYGTSPTLAHPAYVQ